MKNNIELAKKLICEKTLSKDEFVSLIDGRCEETEELLKSEAVRLRKEIYGNSVYIRGLIEISNICKNDCLYCGIRKSNKNCERYRLAPDEIYECCDEGYELGMRTFVLQGGEDGFYSDKIICETVKNIKNKYPDCAVTLSLGERSKESYKKLYDAGADRYLLRHETANKEHYEKLHPKEMSYENRIKCLYDLKDIGFQTGCGFMVGSPFQTTENIAEDLLFIKEFSPDMCGIGPFIPHCDTVFGDNPPGSVNLCLFLLSVIRILKPNVLLPATTALGTLHPQGREMGILSGANVVMPNLSPKSVRKKYALYDNKLCDGAESAQSIEILKKRMSDIGYEVVTDVGHIKK
ncbi:MAG: [FeFe] hydrogenase H-cluster radical SAM maturase HydE [Ruminococcaceae bacterium]|nr:[FeFe] hydrogenase H-cluster radical SAM maturase HydE [Oscillospiraceae bacterium]